jgi:hypothetical protein
LNVGDDVVSSKRGAVMPSDCFGARSTQAPGAKDLAKTV